LTFTITTLKAIPTMIYDWLADGVKHLY